MKTLLLSILSLASLSLWGQPADGPATLQQPLKGHYLGMKKPGRQAELFAKGIVSTEAYQHSAPAFSPDGNILLWGEIQRDKPSYLLEMKRVNGEWTSPTPPSFASGLADDLYPRFSPDGKKLYFTSRRPLPAGFPPLTDCWIWVVDKKVNGWSEPQPLRGAIFQGVEYAHSVSQKGTICFSFRKQGGKIFDLACAKRRGDSYASLELLGSDINTEQTEDGPCLAPDESFLVFESSRPGGLGSNDLYVSFREKDGRWSKPKNMGPGINTVHSERFAGLSSDGRFLFFGSDRGGNSDIYWMDASVIQELHSNN
jgi:Tol biopolymer transport system component